MRSANQDESRTPLPSHLDGAERNEADAPDFGDPAERVGVLSGFVWGLSGFVIGAVFWHFIGFWSFVEKIVYSGRPEDQSHYVAQYGTECTAIVLDRETREVASVPCPLQAPMLNEQPQSARGDFQGGRTPIAKSSHRQIRLSAGDN
jgi:hypothetical protein